LQREYYDLPEGHQTMSRRRANRAEAIVKGLGAIILLFLLLGVTQGMPQILSGKNPSEMIGIMFQIIVGFAFLTGLVAVIGLIVWVKVRNGRRK
jgi:hypothetical protein